MKANTHPQFNEEAKVVCACGNTFTVGSTQDSIHIELCNKCHPFYTGEQKFVDSASMIQRFQKKQDIAQKYKATATKKAEDQKRKSEAPKSLREMLQALQ
jgi:large subunit ribosomal protein L31